MLLERWRGTHAQAWEYSCSHSRFLLRLIRHDEKMNPLSSAYILCYDCFSLQFEDGWKGVDLRIESTASNPRKNCIVTDREHLRIVCSGVSAVETTVMPFIHLAANESDGGQPGSEPKSGGLNLFAMHSLQACRRRRAADRGVKMGRRKQKMVARIGEFMRRSRRKAQRSCGTRGV